MSLLLVTLLTLFKTNAGECLPRDANFDFARVIMALPNVSAAERRDRLHQACAQLNPHFNNSLLLGRAMRRAERGPEKTDALNYGEKTRFAVTLMVHHDAVTETLGDSAPERAFRSELERVKMIADPRVRMARAYTLSHEYQGRYMPDGQRRQESVWPSPGKTLRRAERTGMGGICRDFASLLTYALNQVAKGPDGQAQFRAEYLDTYSHAVVKVRSTPSPTDRFAAGDVFALDPTNFDRFTPIPVPDLFASDELLEHRRDQCDRILACTAPAMVEATSLLTPVSYGDSAK